MSDPIHTIRMDDPAPDTERTDSTEPMDEPTGMPPPFAGPEKERSRDMRRLEAQLTEVYVTVGTYGGMAAGKRGMLSGTIVAANAGILASSWIDLAERDARVKRALQNIVQSGGWAGVIGAHVVAVLPILAVYGVLPEQMIPMVWMGVAAQNPQLYETLQNQTAAFGMNGNGDTAS